MRTVLIMGAGGRDFHDFNVVYRGDGETRVVAFTATQIPGIDDRVADPLFVAPSADAATADFRLLPGSPAASGGRWELFTPATDLAGRPRPAHAAPALGAFQP